MKGSFEKELPKLYMEPKMRDNVVNDNFCKLVAMNFWKTFEKHLCGTLLLKKLQGVNVKSELLTKLKIKNDFFQILIQNSVLKHFWNKSLWRLSTFFVVLKYHQMQIYLQMAPHYFLLFIMHITTAK